MRCTKIFKFQLSFVIKIITSFFAENCGGKGDNITLEVVGDIGNNTWVKGHKGPVFKGEIRKPEGFSNALIKGGVDGINFEFNVEIKCIVESNGLVSL